MEARRCPEPDESGRCHRAYLVKPSDYRIEDALDRYPSDWWAFKGKPLAIGDRAVFWRGRDANGNPGRGVVGLEEVVAGPEDRRHDASDPCWRTTPPEGLFEMVEVRYVPLGDRSLWLGGQHRGVLRRLSVARARGGTLFHVAPEQWDALVKAAGGWWEEAAEVREVLQFVGERKGRHAGGQGIQPSAAIRQAVERRAMDVAVTHYLASGWHVEDVSSRRSYDPHCTRPAVVPMMAAPRSLAGTRRRRGRWLRYTSPRERNGGGLVESASPVGARSPGRSPLPTPPAAAPA